MAKKSYQNFRGRRPNFPPLLLPGLFLTSPDSNLRIDATSPPALTVDVTIRASCHTKI